MRKRSARSSPKPRRRESPSAAPRAWTIKPLMLPWSGARRKVISSVLFRWFLVDIGMLEEAGLSTCITTYTGRKTCEIGARQGANRNEVEHLVRIGNAAWRRFSSGFRQGTNGTGH